MTQTRSGVQFGAVADTDRITRFRLELPGLTMELAGEKKVVESLYQSISADLLPVLFPSRSPGAPAVKAAPAPPQAAGHRADYTWLYVCTTYYNKVYAVENTELASGALGECLDIGRLSRVYLDDVPEGMVTTLAPHPRTLWSEFTEEGRRRFRTKQGHE